MWCAPAVAGAGAGAEGKEEAEGAGAGAEEGAYAGNAVICRAPPGHQAENAAIIVLVGRRAEATWPRNSARSHSHPKNCWPYNTWPNNGWPNNTWPNNWWPNNAWMDHLGTLNTWPAGARRMDQKYGRQQTENCPKEFASHNGFYI